MKPKNPRTAQQNPHVSKGTYFHRIHPVGFGLYPVDYQNAIENLSKAVKMLKSDGKTDIFRKANEQIVILKKKLK